MMLSGWFREKSWNQYLGVNISALMENTSLLRMKEPAFNAVMNELEHYASPYRHTLTRQLASSSPPIKGDTLDIQWEMFSENSLVYKEPGDGEYTITYTLEEANTTIPGEQGNFFVKGKYQINTVSQPQGDGKTFFVTLREVN